ncbi:MotA/TolQ/ExbB proton channel family protein [Luteolibacter flavescens]|uniref:MotA/TolQ/ExbB proton channel family protein n=1 Tax=Luteolibacter flavescens TaxID=1859460 RepID=A0ABT3FTQ2_9BACT|nr:MotA/TolQ/ExbB proton channel family protein [Luteolibacter flavescens]MCW1886963.1 MotA/TolQ/ExbB proton channel family protein [Luteolibacter flavescens]
MPTEFNSSGLLENGGLIIWLQAALAFFGAVFVVERLFFFHRARINVGDLLVGLSNHVRRKAYAEAMHEAARAPGPVARVAHAILLRHSMERPDLRDIAQEAGQLEVPRIEKNLRGILGVAVLAPMTGMLGTVLGLWKTFEQMSANGSYAGPVELTSGVGTALVATVVGLVIAIPAYLFYLYFLGRTKRLLHRLERTGIEMVNMICDARIDTGIVSMRDELEARRREERKK